ncbi:MAG: DedA family protein [Alphaproteobacteria bacterium]|nr:DedA family protein [Alphaproteobacteria bacterium]
MFDRMYRWAMRTAQHPQALKWLGVISFAESSFFPIPPDVVLAPMVLARRHQAFLIATICTVTSVAGGVFGWAIGYFLYDTLGAWLIRLYGLQQSAEAYHAWYAEWGAWVILIKGLTPIPYKLVTIASGLAKFDIWIFIAASIVTRGARFYLIAALLWKFGPPIQDFIEKRLNLVGWVFLIALVGGFVAVKYL